MSIDFIKKAKKCHRIFPVTPRAPFDAWVSETSQAVTQPALLKGEPLGKIALNTRVVEGADPYRQNCNINQTRRGGFHIRPFLFGSI